jgi:two-component system, chemotaxis family, CheB/CheR fusion protein
MNAPYEAPTESRPDTYLAQIHPDQRNEPVPENTQNPFPLGGESRFPIVALGGSAGSLTPLQTFLAGIPRDRAMAFVVVLLPSPEHTGMVPEILQRSTPMPVVQVQRRTKLEPDHVYVVPPDKHPSVADGCLSLSDLDRERGGRASVDLFFRTLADSYGPSVIAVVLSGAESDGAVGLKRIKERGGLTIVQDPEEARHAGMPRSAIDTGMVDWVLRAAEMPARIADYCRAGRRVQLLVPAATPPADPAESPGREAAVQDILALLHVRTGRDFSSYKRGTILRRIARRMQVNNIQEPAAYHQFLRGHPDESAALLQDLLISVTNFFRDRESFRALAAHMPDLFRGKGPDDSVRVWVPACATGEEAYSIAMLLREYAGTLKAPPKIQVFATDLDESAITTARIGQYPESIATDVSEERLRRHFVPHHGHYRVSQALREIVLFAVHDLLKNPPFSRVDLISCRNLLIYLNPEAQRSLFDIFHFALRREGLLFLGDLETAEDAGALFSCIEKRHSLFRRNSIRRGSLAASSAGRKLRLPEPSRLLGLALPDPRKSEYAPPPGATKAVAPDELHLKLIERVGPPSMVVNGDGDILHLSASVGRYLRFAGGMPTLNLIQLVAPRWRGDLRSALFHATQSRASVEVNASPWEREGKPAAVNISVHPMPDVAAGCFLVVFREKTDANVADGGGPRSVAAERVIMNLERELEQVKAGFRRAVEEHSAIAEETKASNEELRAVNEELRSASEELETGRRELQSVNEELIAVNAELKSKVEELARTNSDLQNLMGATNIATIFLDDELRIKRYTPPAIAIFNLIPTDAGRPLSHLTHRLAFETIVADAGQVLRTLIPVEREVQSVCGRWFLVRAIPYRTGENEIAGVVLTFIDITERKRAEEVLRSSRQRMAAIFAQAAVGLCEISFEGRFLRVNDELCRILGRPREALLELGVPEVTHADDREKCQAAFIALVESGEPVAIDKRYLRADGGVVWASNMFTRIDDEQGRPQVVLAVIVDLTVRKQAEESLRQGREDLERRVEERTLALHQANQALRLEIAERRNAEKVRQGLLRQLVGAQEKERGRISRELHDEIGQHLSALILGMRSLDSSVQGRDAKETLKTLLEVTATVGREIRELALELRPTALDDLGLLRTLQNYAAEWSARSRIAIKFHSSGLEGAQLSGHVESTLYRIACESLNNVLKHSGASEVGLILERRDQLAVVIVEDNGRGFDPEELPKQSHRDRLGLLGMKERAHLLDGELTVESSPGRGTTVIARIPIPPEGAPGPG